MKQPRFIAVIDFGSQYTNLILRNLRELGVPAQILAPTVNIKKLKNAAGLILSGGPKSVVNNAVAFNSDILKLPVPKLGICYGLQLLAKQLGGQVTPGKIREYGLATLRVKKTSPLFSGIPNISQVWMSHGDSVTKLPSNFITLGSTATLNHAATQHRTKPIYGLQFHPEVNHTTYGKNILSNFIFNICQLKPANQQSWLAKISIQIKKQVGNKKVFLLVSGGVDSTVAFALLNKILGAKKVLGLHIDTGLMRLGESKLVNRSLHQAGFKNLKIISAGKTFLLKLKNITEPEQKRNIIGNTFLVVKKQIERKLKLNSTNWLMGQGTIYPDTIESGGSKHADKIKTHHNRIGILTKMASEGLLVEPLKELYKDEVRRLGLELGLPQQLIWAHPFPGPGLGVRLLCLNKKKVQELTNKIPPNIRVKNYPTRILPIESVGVQGDERSYSHPLAIDASHTTAYNIHKLGTELVNKNKNINRVILKLHGPDLNLGKPYPAYITRARIKMLQQADDIVINEIKKAKLYYKIWQCPSILIPFGNRTGESLVLRPFASREAMTGRSFLLPFKAIMRIRVRLKKLNCFDYIFYDLTDKPPGTIEWE